MEKRIFEKISWILMAIVCILSITIGSVSVLDVVDYEDQFVRHIVLVLIVVVFLTWTVGLICNIKSVSP